MKDGTWDQMPVSVSQHPTLSPLATALFVKIASFIRPGDSDELLTKNLAAWFGVSERTLRRLVSELTEADVLVVERTRTQMGHQGPNRYSWGPVALAGQTERQTLESAGLAADQTLESDSLAVGPDCQESSPRLSDLPSQTARNARGKALRAKPKSQTQEPDKKSSSSLGSTSRGEGEAEAAALSRVESPTDDEHFLKSQRSPSRPAAGSPVVERGRDADEGVALPREESTLESGHTEQPTEGDEAMTEPVWTRVGLPTHDEMLQFFWDCHGWVEHSHAKVLTKWVADPGGLEEYRAEVARWQKRTRAERKYQAARVELAEFTAEAEAWREFAQFGPYPLSPQRDHPLERRLSPPCNELEMQGDHLVLTAYVSARRRGLTHDHIMAETKALPVLETYPAPDMTDWLDGLAEPVTEAAEPATMAEPATEATPWPPEPWDMDYGQQQTAMVGTEDW